MFSKIHLSVTVALLLMGCKNIGDNYSALDDGGDRPSGSWAMVDLYLHEADDPEDEGEVNLHLSPHLTQDTRVNGVNLRLVANGSLNFSAPDANNVATLAEEDLLISIVEINFVNSVNALVCPDNPIVAELDRKDEEDQIEIGGVIFSAMDLSCSGNKLVEMNTLAHSIVTHTWNEDHEAVLKKVDGFYEKEKKKGEGGALHKGEDQDINDHIDNFLIRRKMLKGYAAMHSELGKHKNLAEIKKPAKGDSAKHVVIPATLKSFLDARVNNRVTPDDDTSGDEKSTDLLLLKEAIGNTAVKFLQYDHLFQSDSDFASAETRAKFTELKGRLEPEVREHVDAIETQFNKLKTDDNIYSSASQVYALLSERVACMDAFLATHKEKKMTCEDILGDFYQRLTSLSCGDKEVDDADVFILLTTRKIMEATNIYDPCDKYSLNPGKFSEKSLEMTRDSVANIKKTALKAMEDILASYPGQNFRTKVLQNYFYATVPIVTQHPARAAELSSALAEAHEEVYAKRESDENWQRIYAVAGKAVAAVGILSVVLWLIPPAGVIVTGATSLLGALAVAGSGFLGAGYLLEWKVHEKNEMDALEKAIYSGGHGDVAGLADTMMEFREARRNALWELGFTAVGAGGARQLIRDPRALRTAYTKPNLKESWKNWRQARKAAKEARKAAKEAAQTPEGIEWSNFVRGEINTTEQALKNSKKALKQAEKNLNKAPADASLKKDVERLRLDLQTNHKYYNELIDELPKGRVKRASDWMAKNLRSLLPTNAKSRGVKNIGTGETIEIVDEANVEASRITKIVEETKVFFTRAKDRLKTAHKNIYAFNREAWKNSDRIKYMKELASTYTKGGGKFYWRLNKDGSAVFKLNDKAYKVLWDEDGISTISKLDPKDFKLGKDGYWIAVLTAERLDELLVGNRGKRAIEGRLQQLPGL